MQLNLPEVEEPGDAEDAPENVAIPVLQAEGDESQIAAEASPDSEIVPDAEAVPDAAAETHTDLPELEPLAAEEVEELAVPEEDDVEELVVSEWPDPVESTGVATLETHDGGEDKDASAGGG